MSDDYGVRIIEVKCGNTRVHKEHEWRHGFLKLRKTKCEGRPPLTEDELWKAANPNLGIINMDKVMSKEDRSLYDINRPEFQGNFVKPETTYLSYKLDADPTQSILDWQAKWSPNVKTHNQSVAEKIIPLEQIDSIWNDNCNLEREYLKDPLKDRETFARKQVGEGKWSHNTARYFLGMMPEHRHSYKLQKIHSKAFIWFRCSDCKIEAVIPRMTLGYPNPWQ